MALNPTVPGVLVFGRRRFLQALAPPSGEVPGVICPPVTPTVPSAVCDLDIDISASNTNQLLLLGDDIIISISASNTEDDISLLDDISIGFSTVLT